ncbi:uncharacterized protein LOC117178576 [Belonocnema kinseyi]|uniref:uncharacterized protein LOC117178576 n=1 Tax=Belonocnema kinseyi TaxID=2817044 RepID=UPI00143CCEA5|nr:uncharacterized protein LOC117178576 [Belonocnema kinseyi]
MQRLVLALVHHVHGVWLVGVVPPPSLAGEYGRRGSVSQSVLPPVATHGECVSRVLPLDFRECQHPLSSALVLTSCQFFVCQSFRMAFYFKVLGLLPRNSSLDVVVLPSSLVSLGADLLHFWCSAFTYSNPRNLSGITQITAMKVFYTLVCIVAIIFNSIDLSIHKNTYIGSTGLILPRTAAHEEY